MVRGDGEHLRPVEPWLGDQFPNLNQVLVAAVAACAQQHELEVAREITKRQHQMLPQDKLAKY